MTDNAFIREIERVIDGETRIGLGPQLVTAPGATLARRFRHNAPLVTQLMAVRMDAPQTRARRRAGPGEGVAAYGATGDAIKLGRRVTGASWPA